MTFLLFKFWVDHIIIQSVVNLKFRKNAHSDKN